VLLFSLPLNILSPTLCRSFRVFSFRLRSPPIGTLKVLFSFQLSCDPTSPFQLPLKTRSFPLQRFSPLPPRGRDGAAAQLEAEY